MNTIHTISKVLDVPYTIVGKKSFDKKQVQPLITILLLNSGGKFYREELLTDLSKFHFAEILYIEGPDISYDIEPLSNKFSEVKFILLKDHISTGEKINLGILESHSVYNFVLWSYMNIVHASFHEKSIGEIGKNNQICTIPYIENNKHEPVPIIQVPGYMKGNVKVIPWTPTSDACMSLFPYDYCGIYHKEKFKKTGGFDPYIVNPYWQKVDFGFRSLLWGEEIVYNRNIHITCKGDILPEDVTPDESYKRFYLKNIYVTYKKGGGYLPYYKFLHYLFHSNTGPITSFKEFYIIRKWVKENSTKFKTNAQNIILQWKAPEE